MYYNNVTGLTSMLGLICNSIGCTNLFISSPVNNIQWDDLSPKWKVAQKILGIGSSSG